MNIFYLDKDHVKSASYYVDRHVIKIPLEITQMLSFALNSVGVIPPNTKQGIPFKRISKHTNHPMSKWIRNTRENYIWTIAHLKALCNEYTYRYNKHLFVESLIPYFEKYINLFRQYILEPFPICTKNDCKTKNPIKSYRNYYINYKSHLFKWKNRRKPKWII